MPPVRTRSRQMVDALDGLNRVAPKPGFRPVHAKGICLEGMFTAAPDARTLTHAAHMQGQEVPVTVRFSNASGYPRGSDTAKEPRGMAVKFHLPDNQSTDLVAMSTPFFPVGTVEDFLDIVRVQTRVPASGEPNKASVEAFLHGHPQAGKWLALVTGTPLPESFARIIYH